MIARVVRKRDEPRLALAATAASALGLAAVVLDDLLGASLFRPPDVGVYGAVALLISVGGIGPWLAWHSRGQTRVVTCEPGVVRAGDLTVQAGEVTALRIAIARRGRSVAVARGTSVVFLEVEHADEAQRIATALNVPMTPFGALDLRPPVRWARTLQLLVAIFALACGPLYFLATRGFDPVVGISGKAIFGIGGVAAAWLSLVILATRRFAPGGALAVGQGIWDAHVALHRAHAERAEVDAVRSEEEKRANACEEAEASARAEPIRVANLGRGRERAAAWLARLDALPSESHAYRGDALSKDVLWETLGDDGAPVDARMAAARLLRRRHGEEERALVRVVDDHDVRARVVAALEEQHEDAEEQLRRLGPLFHAR